MRKLVTGYHTEIYAKGSEKPFGTFEYEFPIQLCKNILKDVPGGFPKSDLLGVTVTLIHVAGLQFLAV